MTTADLDARYSSRLAKRRRLGGIDAVARYATRGLRWAAERARSSPSPRATSTPRPKATMPECIRRRIGIERDGRKPTFRSWSDGWVPARRRSALPRLYLFQRLDWAGRLRHPQQLTAPPATRLAHADCGWGHEHRLRLTIHVEWIADVTNAQAVGHRVRCAGSNTDGRDDEWMGREHHRCGEGRAASASAAVGGGRDRADARVSHGQPRHSPQRDAQTGPLARPTGPQSIGGSL